MESNQTKTESVDLIHRQMKSIQKEKNITTNSKAHHLVFGYIRNIQSIEKLSSISSDIYNLLFIFYYQSFTFEHVSDYDENGILYWLGTDCGQSPWQNPAKRKLISLHSSGMGIGVIEDMICRGTASNPRGLPLVGYTGPNPWFIIDFGKYTKVRTSCYTLRHSQNWFGLIRGWNFEGSNDGITWEIIKKHRDDQSFKYDCIVNTFDIDTAKCKQYYQYFRIYETDRQHHGHWEITASCLEIYGHLIKDVNDGSDNDEFCKIKKPSDNEQSDDDSDDDIEMNIQ